MVHNILWTLIITVAFDPFRAEMGWMSETDKHLLMCMSVSYEYRECMMFFRSLSKRQDNKLML